MSFDFQTTTHGKWILVGEHAVIRGHGALAFPVTDKTLTLSYQKATDLQIKADYLDKDNQKIQELMSKVLHQGAALLDCNFAIIRGHFHLISNIPAGVGMGASAALCVAIARWFIAMGHTSQEQLYPFARELEHLFHGQSSGLDIASVMSTSGIYFQQGTYHVMTPVWTPQWQLSSSEHVGCTSDCIQQVQKLWDKAPLLAAQLDQQMHASTLQAQQALNENTPQAKTQLINAMNQAADCFQQWGLITPALATHMQALRDQGALAVKPTGSGGGGMVVSLW